MAASILGVVLAVAGVAAVVVPTSPGEGTDLPTVGVVAAETANPLAGRPWGVYKGPAEQSWAPYVASTGTNRTLLAKIALRPKAAWFGAWTGNDAIAAKVDKYIANSTGGDPDVLVQMTVFRMVPWEHAACSRLPTADEQASYRQWIDRFAAAIGDAHVALILQPDGPFERCVPGHSLIPSRLIAYSAKRFSAQQNTSVYIDGGASDWPANHPELAADFLLRDGVQYARGFALNSTHYSRTVDNIDYGTQVVAELAKRAVPDRHFVISTSSNGRGFNFSLARGSHPDNAKTCETMTETVCVTLGIPPTADVANARWRQSALHRARAAAHVDGYLWFGRPWLTMQSSPFDMARALDEARTTPW